MNISKSLPFSNLSVLSLCFFILINHIVLAIATLFATKIDQEDGITGNATESTDSPPPLPMDDASNFLFKSRTFTIMGMLTIVLAITVILLLYIQHCHATYARYQTDSRAIPLSREHSGVDKKVIQYLPLFRFASLRGQKDGLECSVCLTKFESEEVLRLLPKCKHAFHVECVDTWLDTHSTCPLCRYRVNQKDVLLVDHHESYKTLYNYKDSNGEHPGQPSSRIDRGNSLEIIIENPEQDSLSRSSSDASHPEHTRENLSKELSSKSLDSEKTAGEDRKMQVERSKHRLEHRIIISSGDQGEEEEQQRWSNAGVEDILFLRLEIIMEGSGGAINERSTSERIGMRRSRNATGWSKSESDREDGVGKRWMAWMSRSQRQKTTDVPPATSSSSSSSVL